MSDLETWSDVSGSYCEDCVRLSMDLDEREMDDRMRAMIERWEAESACKRGTHGAGDCGGRGVQCMTMASYQEAQLCARLTCLCKDSFKLPQASLRTRIVQMIELCK